MNAPARIRISDEADALIDQWASDLYHGRIEYWQLPTGLKGFWTLAFYEGRDSRQAEVDRANADADRYYQHAYNPRKEMKPGLSYADLERLRGNPERAAEYEQFLNQLFNDHFGGTFTLPAAEERTTE